MTLILFASDYLVFKKAQIWDRLKKKWSFLRPVSGNELEQVSVLEAAIDLGLILWYKCDEIQIFILHLLQRNQKWLVLIYRANKLRFAERDLFNWGRTLKPVLDWHLVEQTIQERKVVALDDAGLNSAQVFLNNDRLFRKERVFSLVGVGVFE